MDLCAQPQYLQSWRGLLNLPRFRLRFSLSSNEIWNRYPTVWFSEALSQGLKLSLLHLSTLAWPATGYICATLVIRIWLVSTHLPSLLAVVSQIFGQLVYRPS